MEAAETQVAEKLAALKADQDEQLQTAIAVVAERVDQLETVLRPPPEPPSNP